MNGNVLTGTQATELRNRPLAKMLWMLWAPMLSDSTPVAISARGTAELLGAKSDNIRRALRHLVACGFLVVTTPATGGTPAEYLLGPRAMPRRRKRTAGRATALLLSQTPPDTQQAA
ncbi:MAG: hypothetical protein K2Y26_01005 [Gemmatimonadaceae bacterium]|nr:hypothetical protein [Gemmatimonadaceae bacterium]